MLVADANQLASSATLGAGAAEAMSFSNDPALFIAMIANLYSNQKLAFIRETICNAWDAHIEANITDRPIEITITDSHMLILRDYGTGIPVSKMKATYNTLGGTTKRDNTKTTGGFGLGCKSPIAYVESFKVTTINNGTKAIYNMVKSAVELNGCPGLVPIVQMPTDEPSGMELQIQLDQYDISEISGYIRSVCFNGEIKAVFNEALLPTLGMSFEPGSYNITNDWYASYMGRGSVFVRYGNVIYPALETPATERALDLVRQFMNIIGAHVILVQAAPSTLALAPSREAFTSQKMTEDGIADMCVALVDKMEAEIKANLPDELNKLRHYLINDRDWKLGSVDDLWEYIPSRSVRGYIKSSLYAKQRNHLRKEMVNLYYKGMLNNVPKNWDKRGKLLQVMKECTRKGGKIKPYTEFLRKHVINPIYAKLSKIGIRSKDVGWFINRYGYEYITDINEKARWIQDPHFLHMVNCNRVFITTRMADLGSTLRQYPPFEWDWESDSKPDFQSLVVRVGTKKGEATAMVSKFKAAGWEVIDLTKKPSWDPKVIERRNAAESARRNKATKGSVTPTAVEANMKPNRLISVSCLWNAERKRLVASQSNATHSNAVNYNHTDVEKPEYYIEQRDVNERMLGLFMFWKNMTKELKDVTVVCRNQIEVNKAKHRGAVHLDELVGRELVDKLFTKQADKYFSQLRKKWLVDLNIESSHLKVLRILGIKFPLYEKLSYDPELENAFLLLCDTGHGARTRLRYLIEKEIITGEESNKLLDMDSVSNFVHADQFRKLYKMFWDPSVGDLLVQNSSAKDFLIRIKRFPESIPAYKLLVKNALKREI